MELLIPGLILVALMIYVSTKIKKNAAKAYESEFIETDEFSLTKPAGFLNPLNDVSKFAFEAYSKDFGSEPHQYLRASSIELAAIEGSPPEAVRDEIKNISLKIVSERTKENAVFIEAEHELNGAVVDVFYKVLEGRNKVWRLRAFVLPEHKDEFLRRIEEVLESFALK